MPVIYLKQQNCSYDAGQNVKVTVKCDNHTPCTLFKKYTHTLDPLQNGGCHSPNNNIYVHKAIAGWAFNGNNCLNLKCENGYESAKLQCVDVYFNKYETKTPLLFVLHFAKNGNSNGVQNRYYRMSCFDTDSKNGCKCKSIDELCEYNEQSILCALLQENDKLDKVLTYDIMKRPTGAGEGNGDGGTNCTYNCGKISVTDDTKNANGEPKVGAGFTRYKHAPTSTGGNSNGGTSNAGKQACVIYRCQTLMGGNGTQAQSQELTEIQGQKYKHVCVYFGCIAKRPPPGTAGTSDCKPGEGTCPPGENSAASATCTPGPDTCPPPPAATEPTSPCNQDVPLMLELLKNGTNSDTGANQPEYYAHFRSTNGARKNGNSEGRYYWVQITGANSGNGAQNTLKNLLDDIGLPASSGGTGHNNGHETLKQLLKEALNNGATDAQNGDLTTQLQKAKGKNLTKLLGQSVNGSDTLRTNGSKTLITLLLRRVEFDITDSLVFLLDKKCKNAHNGSASGPNGQGSYGDEDIQKAISGLQPSGRGDKINRLKLGNGNDNGNGKQIKVTDVTTTTAGGTANGLCACLKKYGYCVIQHDFGTAVTGKLGQGCSAGLRLFIPAMSNEGGNGGGHTPKYQELKLYPGEGKTGPENLQYLYYTKGTGSDGSATCATPADAQTCSDTQGPSQCSKTQNAQICSRLYVVFYHGKGVGGNTGGSTNGDPRPLLLGYGGCWYRPKDKDTYCEQWVRIQGVEKTGACECQDGGSGGADVNCEKCKALLKALTQVVGFLNTVDLFQHPKGTAGEGAQTQCQPCENGGKGPAATCKAEPTGKCKYEVHKFDGKPIRVQVECCPVTNSGGSSSSSCYSRLTHVPLGTNGTGDVGDTANGSGFRLGDVVYRGNGCTGDTCKIDYYNNGGTNGDHTSDKNKWAPLLSVTAYFYNHDTGYCDPLLVELQFAKVDNGVQNGATTTEYYRLKTRNGDSGSGGTLVWAKVDNGSKLGLAKPGCLTRYLDSIRYCLKKVVRIHLECKNGGDGYALEGRDASSSGGGSNGFQKINGDTGNGKQIQVQECTCPALTARKYKCLKHGLTEALKPVHYQVAGLVFTLPGRNGDAGANGVVEIPLYSAEGVGPGGCPSSQSEGGCPAAPPGPTASCSAVTGAPTTGTQIPPVHYNQCMGDVCVYFYGSGGGTSGSETGTTTDTVPLMLRYNGQFYRPYSRDQYFDKWVCVPALAGTKGECKGGCACCPGVGAAAPGTSCGASGAGGDGATCPPECPCCSKLAEQLDRVNECLNRVDLDKSRLANNGGSSGAGTGYGLPENRTGSSFKTDRVTLVKQEPTGNDAQKAYVKVVHRTKNGFRIGQLMYCSKDITSEGVNLGFLKNGQCDGPGSSVGACSNGAAPVNGQGTTIRVANGSRPNGNGNHKGLVTTCGWNTVVVYYSTSDKCYRLPQLIVLLKTDAEVKGDTAITSSTSQQKYGYYILATKNGSTGGGAGSTGYAYQWRLVNGSKTPVKLDDKTDFQLLNAAVILLERRKGTCLGGSYNDREIKKAVESAIKSQSELKSPGHSGDVNRLTGKTITVSEEPGEGAGAGTHQCLKDTGFKVMTHDLTPFVKLNGSFKPPLCKINLIAGLKLLIPTGERGKYKQVQLNGDATKDGAQNGSVRYHHPDNGDKVCVYFYGCDPRPLLVCYNGWAYAAKDKNGYNEQKWTQCTEVQGADAAKCGCSQQPPPPTGTCDKCPLLKALVGVSDFLNPVDVKQVPNSTSKYWKFCRCYCVHKFNGCKIWIRVTSQPAIGSFCYDRFTHTHAGITGKGDGFRLGNIHYDGRNKGENGNNNNSNTCIKLNGTNSNGNKCISASDVNDSKNHKASPEVVVFYYKHDKELKSPIVVALCEKSDTSVTCKQYYVLKDRDNKVYGKMKKTLNLSDKDKLDEELDKALFNNSKKLQIVLSTRPVATEYSENTGKECDSKAAEKAFSQAKKYGQIELVDPAVQKAVKEQLELKRACKARMLKEVANELEKTSKTTGTTALTADKPLATRAALMHHVTLKTTYKAHLCDNNGKPSSPPEPATPSEPKETKITVTQVTCNKSFSEAGYRCFKHDLVSANHIESVGGLVLCLWVDKVGRGGPGQGAAGKCQPCTEGGVPGPGKEGLELCTGNDKGSSNGKVELLTYNTCKGNLYVFSTDIMAQKLH